MTASRSKSGTNEDHTAHTKISWHAKVPLAVSQSVYPLR